MLMLNIYLTRHGETKWNKENRLQGWKNSELTENGIENAILLGKRLNHIDIKTIYSSPSKRALDTAKLISLDRNIPKIVVNDLKEISFGEWEGKTQEEIENHYKEDYLNFWNRPHEYNHLPHKGESLCDLKGRVAEAIKGIIETNETGNILIVTHGVVIRAMMSFFWDIPTKMMWEPPIIHGTSLSLVTWNGERFQKELLGDTSHMK